MESKIAVIIPSHNRPEELSRAVKSVFNQTMRPEQLIIIDDGCNPAVTRNIFVKCPREIRAKLLLNEIPKGAPNARNCGIDEATSPWIAFLDDDDEFRLNKIEIVNHMIRRNPNVDVFYHPAEIVMDNERIRYITKPGDFCDNQNFFQSILVRNQIGGTSMVVARRSALINSGKFDEQLSSLQDYELWLRMAQHGFKFKLINQPLTIFHCVTNKASISKSFMSYRKAIDIIKQKYATEYARLGKIQKRNFKNWQWRLVIHKALLNGYRLAAFKLQISQFLQCPRIKYLLLSLALISFGPRLIFRLRGRISTKILHRYI